LRKLDTVIHKNESHRLKMQRDLVVVILYDNISNQPMRFIFMNYSV